MAQDIDLSIDWGPVRSSSLMVYTVAGKRHPVVSIVVEEVRCKVPYADRDKRREFSVEVEFKPEGRTLDEFGLSKYLKSFSEAEVTQEAMTQKIRNDLMRALETDVFVEVHQNSSVSKRTRMGEP